MSNDDTYINISKQQMFEKASKFDSEYNPFSESVLHTVLNPNDNS